jgi:ribonuclease D
VLREIVLQVPRTTEALEAIPEMPPGLVKRRGAELLACVEAAGIGQPAPPLPGRARPDPVKAALVKNLVALTHSVAAELKLAPEVLATRRDLEQLADGERETSLLQGWRREVLGERLLAAL